MILLTGGTGLLGKALFQYFDNIDCPSHDALDITKPVFGNRGSYDLIIHSAAYTDVVRAEVDQKQCFDVNVYGTLNLLNAFSTLPMVYISTEYAKDPLNYYSLTKRFAEESIKNYKHNYLIIRTLFKPRPFPFEKAFVDQYTQGDYVDVIAPMIAKIIKDWDRQTGGIVYVGTGRKTIYELAKQTRPDVGQISVEDIKDVKLPKDYL